MRELSDGVGSAGGKVLVSYEHAPRTATSATRPLQASRRIASFWPLDRRGSHHGAVNGSGILDDLAARGLVQDHTDLDALRRRLDEGPITVYAGFDPTADTLHVGNLIPLLLLRRFQDAGHRPIVLAGGATGMIGDPGGRSEERNLLDEDTLDRNVRAIKDQLASFVDFEPGPAQAVLVDNRDWTEPMGVLTFLRDVGKHVTVNQMLAKDSVRNRVQSEDGISFTEFTYMLLQANDYAHLHRQQGCELQVGGSDQWGNITAGIDLIRRQAQASVHGLTVPLLLKADGTKYGKSAEGAVWLDPARTSPYVMSQFFVQTEDADVEHVLLRMTLVPVEEVQAVMEEHRQAPQRRIAQRRLARAVVSLVHGRVAAQAAEAAADALFGGTEALTADALRTLEGEIPTTTLDPSGLQAAQVALESGIATSLSDARRAIRAGELWVNSERLGEDRDLTVDDLRFGRYQLWRRGKKRHHLVVVPGTGEPAGPPTQIPSELG
jgi:tyrosyl-tRNA synthetase